MSNNPPYDRPQGLAPEPNTDFYQLLENPSAAVLAAVDGSKIISQGGKLYTRIYTNLAWAEYETAWFIDASSGSDNNSGTDVSHPLKSLTELSRRLWYAHIRQNVEVTVAAGNFDASVFQFRLNIDNNCYFRVRGHITSSAADVITSVLATTPGSPTTNAGAQRGTITGTTGAFTDYTRLRITASATALGAASWVTRVVSAGPGGTANITRWGLADPTTQFTVANKLPANGDSYVIDTFDTIIGDVDVQITGWGIVVLQDLAFKGQSDASMGIRTGGGSQESGGILFYACDICPGGDVIIRDGEATYQLTQFRNVSLGDVSFLSYNADLHMCVLDRVHAQFGGFVSFYDGTCLRTAGMLLEEGALVTLESTGGVNDFQCTGTGTSAIEVRQGALFWAKGFNAIWGLDCTYSVAGFRALAGSRYQFAQDIPSIPGGAVDWTLSASYSGTWANIPKNVSSTTALEGKSFAAANGTAAAADTWMNVAPGSNLVVTLVERGQLLIGYNAVILGMRFYIDTPLTTDDVTVRLQIDKVDAASGMSATIAANASGPVADLTHPQVIVAGHRYAIAWRQTGTQATTGINARVELIILPVNQ